MLWLVNVALGLVTVSRWLVTVALWLAAAYAAYDLHMIWLVTVSLGRGRRERDGDLLFYFIIRRYI
jgi:hypothetical protein